MDGVQSCSSFDQDGVWTAVGRSHAWHEEKAGGRRKFTGLLILLKLDCLFRRTTANGFRGADTVKCLTLEVVQNILRCVVLRAPARVSLISNVDMHVDHCGHDRFSGEIHSSDSRRQGHWAF